MHDFAKLKIQAASIKGSIEAERSVKSLALTVERLCDNCLELQQRIEELEKKLGTDEQMQVPPAGR